MDVVVLSDLIWGVDCHWVSGGAPKKGLSRICTRAERDCELCGRHRMVWLGFIAVLDLRRRMRVVLRIGPETARVIARHAGRVVTLRGWTARLVKTYAGRTASARAEDCPLSAPDPLPDAHSVQQTMRRVLQTDWLPDFTLHVDEAGDVPLPPGEGGVS